MARQRFSNGNLNKSMTFIHKRVTGSLALCMKDGVHTTKKNKEVTCQLCLNKMK